MELPAVRTISHYSSDMDILLVGEGDFSFAASLATAFQTAPRLYATSLDSREMLHTKYGWLTMEERLVKLSWKAVVVINEVDVRTMVQHPSLHHLSFDRIIYNFPHSGFVPGLHECTRALIKKHRALMRSFFKNARRMLKVGGEVHVAHHKCDPYSRWRLEEEASKSGLQLGACRAFEACMFQGYTPRRGAGDDAKGTFPLRNPFTFIFSIQVSNPPPTSITPYYSDSHPTPTHIISSLTSPTSVIPSHRPSIKKASHIKKDTHKPLPSTTLSRSPPPHINTPTSQKPLPSIAIACSPPPSINTPTLPKPRPPIIMPCCPSTRPLPSPSQQSCISNKKTTLPLAHSLVSSPPPIMPPNHAITVSSCPPPHLTSIVSTHQHDDSNKLTDSHQDTHKSLPSTSLSHPPPRINTPTSQKPRPSIAIACSPCTVPCPPSHQFFSSDMKFVPAPGPTDPLIIPPNHSATLSPCCSPPQGQVISTHQHDNSHEPMSSHQNPYRPPSPFTFIQAWTVTTHWILALANHVCCGSSTCT